MNGEKKEYEFTETQSDENFSSWISRKYIGPDLAKELKKANVLIVPQEGFRDQETITFPVNSGELYRFLCDKAPNEMSIDLCIEDKDYKELALHTDLVGIASFVVTTVIFPVLVNLLTDYIKAKLSRRTKDTHIKVCFTIVESDQSSRTFTYEGPPQHLSKVISRGQKTGGQNES